MTTRILPHEEWDRLAATEFHAFRPYASEQDTRVVVVEDGPTIVGCWVVVRITHVEGLWIHPAYRGRIGVARRLLATTVATARQWADRWVMTGAQTPEIARMLRRFGAVQIPIETFVLPIGEGA